MISCSTEVGLMGYVDKGRDSSEAIVVTDTSATDPEPSLEPSEEPVTEGVGGYLRYYLRQVSCPACVGETQELSLSFDLEMHEPISDTHTSWIPDQGSCTENLVMINPSTIPRETGSAALVQGPIHSFQASRIGQGLYNTTNIYETQYDRDGQHIVTFNGSNHTFSFRSLHGFDYIEPWNMMYVDPSYAFDAAIYRNGMTFFWGPSGSSSLFMITVSVYSNDGSQFLGYVTCVGPDQGNMTIPSTYLQRFNYGNLVAIHLARHSVEYIGVESLGSHIESHMEWEVVGTGHIE
jgi:hypothetical protein